MARTTQPATNQDALLLLGEQLKQQSKRPNIYGYKPHDKQIKFHSSPKRRRLYIGGNRSGKTTGGICEDIWYATGTHPFKETPELPVRGRIVGTDFLNGISKIILPEIQRWTPVSVLRGGSWSSAYDKLERVLHFANGSFIEFMSYDQDLDKFAGTSRHFIHFDEEPPFDIYTENMARLVDTGGDAWLTMTPVEGMTWVFETLYLPGTSGSSMIDIIEVSMTENPHLDPLEVALFLDSLSDDERKARGEGKFIQLGGLIYKDFTVADHVIEKDNWKPPADWFVTASLDHGFNNPTAWLWHAVSPDGDIVTYYEYYVSGMVVGEHAKAVLDICRQMGRWPDIFVGDPSIRNTDPITGTSIHQEYLSAGIPLILGNNDVRAGIVRIAGILRPKEIKPTRTVVNELGLRDSALLTARRGLVSGSVGSESGGHARVIRYHILSRCKNLIWEFQRYRWKTYVSSKVTRDNNPREEPVKKDDHALDSLRYFVMSRPELAPEELTSDPKKIGNILGVPEAAPDPYLAPARTANETQSDFVDYNKSSEWETSEYNDMGGMW